MLKFSATRWLCLALLTAPLAAEAQNGGVRVGTPGAPDPSAVLDLRPDAANAPKGLLPPRLTQQQRDAIASPAPGLCVFNTTSNQLNVWDGSQWVAYLADTSGQGPTAFAYTGAPQTYTVPAGITRLRVDQAGAGGSSDNRGGLGGRVQAVLTVTPGQVLTVYVGGAGSSATAGYNGGGAVATISGNNDANGGGGASDIRQGGSALTNRVLVAGGGGGPSAYILGGCGGGLTACAGNDYSSVSGGGGGSQTAPGTGNSTYGGNPGTGNVGGAGSNGGGGGGGGYFGGGGGIYFSGGGGGSSYAGAGTSNVVHTQAFQNGNGYVLLTPVLGTVPAPVLDARNFTNLPPAQTLSLSGNVLGLTNGGRVTLPGDNLGNHTATQNLDLGANQLVGSSGSVRVGNTLDLGPNQLVGNGGSQGLRISSAGRVGIGTGAGTPRGLLDVAGAGDSYLVTNPDNGSSQSLYLPGHLYLAPYAGTSGTAYVQARVPNATSSTNIGLTLRTTNAGALIDAVGITPAGDVNVLGQVGAGYTSLFRDGTLSGRTAAEFTITCPAGTSLLSGGGGHRDFNPASNDITLNYSGPSPSDPEHTWRVIALNQSTSDRAIRIYCNCARIR